MATKITEIRWVHAMSRWRDQGLLHAVGAGDGTLDILCGARPFSTGGSFRTVEEAGGGPACRRCSHIAAKMVTPNPKTAAMAAV